MLDLRAGEKLVKLARAAVERYFEHKKIFLEKIREKNLNEKRGVFVTIETYPEKNLRGCIGFPYPTLPLYEAVQRAAVSSAFEDPRFPPLKKEELDKIIFEISVMTKPELIKVKDSKEYPSKIEVGKDGLILQNGPFSGLLLPQVCLQFNWSAEEFLENLCWKAGLTVDYIHDKNTKIWKFQCQIFAEEKPKGKIIELTKHSS
jgi:uncharacterized protein (TIGR00296 family)